MPMNLNDLLPPDEVATAHRSWEAWSATNLIFNRNAQLLLGLRAEAAKAIPESGDWRLIGGFNDKLAPPAMRADVANAHAKAMLGIELRPDQCSGFLECEYDMSQITKPLTTPLGLLPMKRAAFDRIVILDLEQIEAIRPDGKFISETRWVGAGDIRDMADKGTLSFQHQLGHVMEAFSVVCPLCITEDVGKIALYQARWSR